MYRNGGWRIFVVIVIVLFLLMFSIWAGLSAARAETMYVMVGADDWLNGRAKPDKNSKSECRFYHGDEVNVLEMENGWAKVDYGGEAAYCYVAWDYLSATKESASCQMTVSTTGRLRIRNNPDGKKVVGYLRNGDVVNVAFFFDGWAKVEKGWVDAAYLMAPEEGTP